MENPNENQLSTSSVKAPNALALHESKPAQAKLDSLIAGCFVLQKLYGKQPENIEIINKLFHQLLGKYPAEKAILAFELWLERSQEFPTPADIVNLIKRNGRPALMESDIIAIRKKDGEYRTRAEWDMLAEWEAQQQEGWRNDIDPAKEQATLQENIRLRQQIETLQTNYDQLNGLLRAERSGKELKPALSQEQRIRNTIQAMKENGAPPEDIALFCEQMGVYQEARAA